MSESLTRKVQPISSRCAAAGSAVNAIAALTVAAMMPIDTLSRLTPSLLSTSGFLRPGVAEMDIRLRELSGKSWAARTNNLGQPSVIELAVARWLQAVPEALLA